MLTYLPSNNAEVYSLRKDKHYYLEPKFTSFKTPAKLYGKLNNYSIWFWKSFVFSKSSMGILLTGESGSGKSELANVISNIALANGMSVVMVTELNADLELIRYIDSLTNVVILFDEFGKLFTIKQQDKMLTMMSSASNGKKLFIITENNSSDVSRYIRNRPGRVRYHIDFTRVERDVIIEYCNDNNVDKQYMDDMLDKYDGSTVFSFDHLIALVREHKENPSISFEDMLGVLNLKVLSKEKELSVINIRDIKEDKDINVPPDSDTIDKSIFDTGRYVWIYPEGLDSIRISKRDVVDIDDDNSTITCLVNKRYEVTLEII